MPISMSTNSSTSYDRRVRRHLAHHRRRRRLRAAWRRFIDTAFGTLCCRLVLDGCPALTPPHVEAHKTIVQCARDLPGRYRKATGQDGQLSVSTTTLEERLVSRFPPYPCSPVELVELLLDHHERRSGTEAALTGNGSWFEPFRAADGSSASLRNGGATRARGAKVRYLPPIPLCGLARSETAALSSLVAFPRSTRT